MKSVAAAGVEPTKQRIQHWQDGKTLISMERGSARKYGAPYVTIHRADRARRPFVASAADAYRGLAYDALADRSSWTGTHALLGSVLGNDGVAEG
jgi:salicylate hydroxylase